MFRSMRISHAIRKERKLKLVEEFYEEFGRLPSWNQIYKGVNLGNFLISIRRGFCKISEEQLNRLLKLGFKLEINNKEVEKEQKIKLVEEFYKKYGTLPKWNQTYKGVKLGRFLASIRQGVTSINEEQLGRLSKLNFEMNVRNAEANSEKEQKIKLLEEFYEENGRLPKIRELYKGVKIGVFLSNVKQRNCLLTEGQMERLTKLGFQGITNDTKVGRKIDQVERFYKKYGRLPERAESLSREKPKAGEFLLSIRIGKIRITEKQFLRLQQMDVTLTREQVMFIEKPKVKVKK